MQLDVRFDAADDHGIFDGETAHYTFSSDTLVVRTDADPRRFEKLALHAVKEEGSETRAGGWAMYRRGPRRMAARSSCGSLSGADP